MLDVLIRGGVVVSPDRTERVDVGVKDSRIVALTDENAVDLEAARTVDAHGKYVVPGGIDAHVHFNVALSPVMRAQSATFGGRAAAFGGTTTFIDFALQKNELSLISAIEEKHVELKKDKPDIDYALHAMITGKAPLEVLDEIPSAIASGVSSFKMFTTFSGGSASGSTFTDDGRIWGVMQQTAKHGGIAMVHCEDDCLIEHCVHKLYRAAVSSEKYLRGQAEHLRGSGHQPNAVAVEANQFAALYRACLKHEGTSNRSLKQGASACPVYGEALHNYLAFCDEDYAKPNGMIYHNYPALKSQRIAPRSGRGFARESSTSRAPTTSRFLLRARSPARKSTMRLGDTTGSRPGWVTCSQRA